MQRGRGGGAKGALAPGIQLRAGIQLMEKYNRTKNYPIICTKLKSIKTYLRSFMSQEQLITLGLISIEKEFPSFDVKKEVVQILSNEITFGTL